MYQRILLERRETTLWGLVLADGDRGAGLCSVEPGADSGVGNEASRGKEGEAFRTRPLTARRRNSKKKSRELPASGRNVGRCPPR